MGPAPGTIVLVFIFLAAFVGVLLRELEDAVVPLEDRMSARARAWTALGALVAVLAIGASWWALALWPVGPDAPR